MQKTDDELIKLYSDYLKNKNANRCRVYIGLLKTYVEFLHSHDLSILTIDHKDVTQYKYWLLDKGYKTRTINSHLTAIRGLYSFIRISGICEHTPERCIHNFQQRDKTPRKSLSFEQVRALVEQKPAKDASERELRNYAILCLMVGTGLRVIEAHRANIGDIVQENDKTVLYVQLKGHTEKDHKLELSGEVLEPIRRYLDIRGCFDSEAPLFTNDSNNGKGERLSTVSISRTIKDALKAQGIDDPAITAHSLRHTVITYALANNAGLLNTQQFVGHASPNSTMYYSHELSNYNSFKAKCNAAKRIVDFLFDDKTPSRITALKHSTTRIY